MPPIYSLGRGPALQGRRVEPVIIGERVWPIRQGVPPIRTPIVARVIHVVEVDGELRPRPNRHDRRSRAVHPTHTHAPNAA
jgi:hypothetical protein